MYLPVAIATMPFTVLNVVFLVLILVRLVAVGLALVFTLIVLRNTVSFVDAILVVTASEVFSVPNDVVSA